MRKIAGPSAGRAWLGWIVALGMLTILAALIYPAVTRPRYKAASNTCLSNVKQIMLAHMEYALDYDGRFPYATDWAERLNRYNRNSQVFSCPSDTSPRVLKHYPYHLSYTMNVAANELPTGLLVQQPMGELGVVFDGTLTYGLANESSFRVHAESTARRTLRKTCSLGYADGHAKYVVKRQFSDKLLAPDWLTPVPLRATADLPPLPPPPK